MNTETISTIKVAIFEEHLIFLRLLHNSLKAYKNFNLALVTPDKKNFFAKLPEDAPDVILLNYRTMNSAGFRESIKKTCPDAYLILYSIPVGLNIQLYLSNGISSCLFHNTPYFELIAAIKDVPIKGLYIPADSKNMVKEIWKKEESGKNNDKLSTPEMELLILICSELTIENIADKMNRSHRTIEGYRKTLLIKAHAKNTAGLIRYAVENGLFSFDIG